MNIFEHFLWCLILTAHEKNQVTSSHVLRYQVIDNAGGCDFNCQSYAMKCNSKDSTMPLVSLYMNGECDDGGKDCWEDIRPYGKRRVDSATNWTGESLVPLNVGSGLETRCPDGYFMFGFIARCWSDYDLAKEWPKSIVCRKPNNLGTTWKQVVYNTSNPWHKDDQKFECPSNTFMIGLKISGADRPKVDLLQLVCAVPNDAYCPIPNSPNTVYAEPLVPACAPSPHQYCVVKLRCVNEFYEPVPGTNTVAECRNTGGYNQTLLSCKDVNECNRPDICGPNSICQNVVGDPGFRCSCLPGYSGPDKMCTDNDECASSCSVEVTDPIARVCNNCSKANLVCNNIPGSFTCVLPPNPCNQPCSPSTTSNCHTCDASSTCSYSFPGPYICACQNGYVSSNGGKSCVDVDECAKAPCNPPASTCQNLPGTFACNCSSGFSQINSTSQCTPVNECSNNAQCGGGPSACKETIPKYYCLPLILNVVRNKTRAPFTLTSTAQSPPDTVEITVAQESNCVANPFFSFGVSGRFRTVGNCSRMSTTPSNYTLACAMPPGAGVNLSFAFDCCLNYSVVSPSTPLCVTTTSVAFPFSYPRPVLTPRTLTFAGSTAPNGTANIDVESSGVIVTMSGQNFYQDMQVFFGPSNAPLNYPCALVSATAFNLTCSPQIVLGSNFTFTVVVGAGISEQRSLPGTDMLSFVGDPPVLKNLIGCTAVNSNNVVRLTDCPTTGGVMLQVFATTGKNQALRLPQLFVNGERCLPIGNPTNVSLNCTLPAGVGTAVMVELRDLKTSWFGNVLSYAAPKVTRIFGSSCTNASRLSLTNCSTAPFTLYIEGTNFGESGAIVMINSLPLPAQHRMFLPGQNSSERAVNHRFLSVDITQAFSVNLVVVNTVIVKQLNGEVSGNASDIATFAMLSCPIGYERVGTACSVCSPGRFLFMSACFDCEMGRAQALSGRTSCVACTPGSYASEGQEMCNPCKAGNFTRGGTCELCPIGKYSKNPVNAECVMCEAGTYNNVEGQTICNKCDPGRSSTVNAAMCQNCSEGRVSQTAGSLCLACPRGTFQAQTTMTYCEECGPGRYTSRPASNVCLSCAAGSFHNLTRQTTCALCPVGFFQNKEAAVDCMTCKNGTYARTLGSIVCEKCHPGQFVNISGASTCYMCEPGYAQNDPGLTSCEACSPGFYSAYKGAIECSECAPGFFQNTSGASSCNLCPPGHYANEEEAKECIACSPGSFQPGQAQPRCFACAPGMYQPAPASVSCISCAAGKAAAEVPSTACFDCLPARFSGNRAPVCQSCPPLTIQPFIGQTSCFACTSGSSPDESGKECQCQVGYYSSYSASGALSCLPCPKGSGVCVQLGTKFSEITTLSGWWRASVNSSNFYRCKTPLFCLGQDQCVAFREGPMCALCIPGYKSSGVGGECAPCPESKATSWGITVGICVLLLLLLVVMYYIALRVANAQQERIFKLVAQKNKEAQESLAATLRADDAHFAELRQEIHGEEADASISDFQTDEQSSVVFKPRPHVIAIDSSRRAPNFMYKVKILIGFFQIASYLPTQGDIAWPHAFVDFIGAFAFFNFDFIPWQSLGCAAGINYFVKTIIVGFVPVIAILVLVTFFTISLFMSDFSTLEAQLEKGQKRNALWRQFVRLVLFTIFLLYPLVSKVAFGVYNCVTVEGVSYLVADFELHCYDDTWNTYAIIDGFFVALYPIGIPLAYFWILHSRKHQMREPETILILGFLYEAYTDSAWYWELVDMTHKLVLTSIIVFAPNEQRMAWNMAIMGIYLVCLLLYAPYVRKGDDRFHLQVQATLFSIAFVGFILQDEKPYTTEIASPSQMEALVASLLIFIVLVLLISFVVISGRNVRKIYLAHKKGLQTTRASSEQADQGLSPFSSDDASLRSPTQNKSATESSRSKSSQERANIFTSTFIR